MKKQSAAPPPSAGQRSGAGQTVDWPRAAEIAKRGRMILAGGLAPTNVAAAVLIDYSAVRHGSLDAGLRVVDTRHEQAAGFMAATYGRLTGKAGVCLATLGPGATNLVTGLADCKLDSIPVIAITGQVTTPVIGTDAFQETPIVEVSRGITKHHYLVTDVKDVARIVSEAFHVATSGRPGDGTARLSG